jgi:hypothetical protein
MGKESTTFTAVNMETVMAAMEWSEQHSAGQNAASLSIADKILLRMG